MTNLAKILTAALAVSAPAVPAQTPAAVQSAPAAAPTLKDPNRMICEREDVIGSRLGGKKVCKTALEWQEWRQQAREQVDDWQRRLTANPKEEEGPSPR